MHFAPIAVAIALLAAQPALSAPAQRRDLQELEARASVSELMRQAAEQMRNNNHMCVLCLHHMNLVSEGEVC